MLFLESFPELYSYTEEPEFGVNQACYEELAKLHGEIRVTYSLSMNVSWGTLSLQTIFFLILNLNEFYFLQATSWANCPPPVLCATFYPDPESVINGYDIIHVQHVYKYFRWLFFKEDWCLQILFLVWALHSPANLVGPYLFSAVPLFSWT